VEDVNLAPAEAYQPVLLPRRGELIAWLCAIMCAVAWLVLHLAKSPVFIGLKILAALLIFISIAISMSNWMDRRTVLKIDPQGIAFENGLRKAQLGWQDIRRVEVISSSLGNKVRVLGDAAHFDFRTLAEVKLGGELKGQMGFQDGEKILKEIIQQADLKETGNPEEGCVYYVPR
jgi:hypothetical protein